MPVSTMGNVANRCILYLKFTNERAEEASIPAPWTEINKAELIAPCRCSSSTAKLKSKSLGGGQEFSSPEDEMV